MAYVSMNEVDLREKRICMRVDFNVPVRQGKILNDARLRAALPSIKKALEAEASILLLSHLGRPKEGEVTQEFSLEPVAKRLAELLDCSVRFDKNWLNGVNISPGAVVLGENVRFNEGEKDNDIELSKKMAELCDVFIMDAFASAHRTEASIVGLTKFAPVSVSVAGLLMSSEINALSKALKAPKKPVVAIVAGGKVSDKVGVLKHLLEMVDTLIVGGGIANTFISALDCSVGNSLYEKRCIPIAKELIELAQEKSVTLMIPEDVVVAEQWSRPANSRVCSRTEINKYEKVLDVGPETCKQYESILSQAGTIIWSGPVGMFEIPAFSQGTQALAKAVGKSSAFSIAGGGETLAAIEQFEVSNQISYISTGGGAFLAYLEAGTLPAIAALEARGPQG